MFLGAGSCSTARPRATSRRWAGRCAACRAPGRWSCAARSRSQGCRVAGSRASGCVSRSHRRLARPGSSAGQVLLLLFRDPARSRRRRARRAVLRADRGHRAARAARPRRPSMRTSRAPATIPMYARAGVVAMPFAAPFVVAAFAPVIAQDRACLCRSRRVARVLAPISWLCSAVAHARSRPARDAPFAARPARTGTWGCGYAAPTARMQYTAARSATRCIAAAARARARRCDPGDQGVFPRRGELVNPIARSVHAVRVRAAARAVGKRFRSSLGPAGASPPLRALHRRDGGTALAIVTVYDWWVVR